MDKMKLSANEAQAGLATAHASNSQTALCDVIKEKGIIDYESCSISRK